MRNIYNIYLEMNRFLVVFITLLYNKPISKQFAPFVSIMNSLRELLGFAKILLSKFPPT